MRSNRLVLRHGVNALVCASALAIAGAAHADQAPASQSLQEQFDAASAASEAHRCADAEAIFARLAADPRVKSGSLSAATIALRRGLCELETGDRQQGEAWVRQGLPIVEAAGPAMVIDAADGWLALARLAMHDYDHDSAVAGFRHVLALPGQGDRSDALIGLAMITTFDGDGTALPLTDQVLKTIGTAPQGRDQQRNEARVRTIRARILMAQGRNAEASKEAEKALALSGGLTTKVSLDDVSLRADAAEAALLNSHPERARELLAYTGAGRIQQSPFASASIMTVPDCDDAAGLRPDDVAVVEFSIRSDGRVESAQTTYTRGTYQVARLFAQSVRGWAWQPEAVAKLPPFYRALVRVELRCSKSAGGLPSVMSLFNRRLTEWAQPVLAKSPLVLAGDTSPLALRRKAARLEADGDRRSAGLLLMLGLSIDPIARATDPADSDHVETLLSDADPAQRASAAAVAALARMRTIGLNALVSGKSIENRHALLLKAAVRPVVANDALAQDSLRLQALTAHSLGKFDEHEVAVLTAVADDARLEPASPLRQVALLRLASVAAHDGRRAEAEALFARTGLNEEQCSLIGDIPRLKSANFDNEYPLDAMRMGFEGWVREEFDISADGHARYPARADRLSALCFRGGRQAIDQCRTVRHEFSSIGQAGLFRA